MPKLNVIIASTRPGRVGLPVANWFVERARQQGSFEVAVADLKAFDLPLLDEPKHPRFAQYEHAHTKAWSASVKSADAFVIVTPEYNFSAPPALVNALDYLYVEWNYKPAAFVSYGGMSGGMRSVQMAKQILTTLKMAPIYEAVAIPFVNNHLDENGEFTKNIDAHDKSAEQMLGELRRWSDALAVLRH